MKIIQLELTQYNHHNDQSHDVCEVNHQGNLESVEAFESIKSDLSRLRAYVLDFIKSKGFHGATCDEIEVALNLSHQTASDRCSELKKKGIVAPTYFKRLTRSGRSAAVLVFWGAK